jgi:hypothetical protein
MDEVFCHSWDTSIRLGELTLSTWQTLFSSSQQPFHGLGSVALDGIAIVIQTIVVEETKIKLRRGVAAFGGNKECLIVLPCIRASKPLSGRGIAHELMNSSSAPVRRLLRRYLGIMRGLIRPSFAAGFYMGLK